MEKEQLKAFLGKLEGPILHTAVPNMKVIPCTTESLNKMIATTHLWAHRTAEQIQAFEVALSGITDPEILTAFLERCIRNQMSEEKQLLENRLSKVLSNTNDLYTLCHCQNHARERKSIALIEARTIEVIENTTDFNALFNYWLNLNAGIGTTESQIAIEEKLEQTIRDVSIDNMPEWFVELIRLGNIRTPKMILDPLREKAKQFLLLLD